MRIIFLFILILIFNSCKTSFDEPAVSPGTADFSSVIAIGDNYLSGYQHDALSPHNQKYSIAALLAKQFQLTGLVNFKQSFLSYAAGVGINNKPWESLYNKSAYLDFKTDCKGETNFFPFKDLLSASEVAGIMQSTPQSNLHDYAIPYARMADYSNPQFGVDNMYFNRVCSAPGTATVISDALQQQATFFISYFGMEDIYQFARSGGKGVTLTASSAFEALLDSTLKQLTANGAKGILATIPELNTFPFFTLVPPRGLTLSLAQSDSLNQLTGLNFYQEGENGFFIEYPVGSGNYRQMGNGEHVLLDIPLDSLKCYSMGVIQPIPDRYTLDSTETVLINSAVASYNNIIKSKASKYNLAVADMNSLFNEVKQGLYWNGVKYTGDFIKGGFFSLDGYHPNEKGYALMANYFLNEISNTYGTQLPGILCEECIGIEFP